MLKGMCCMGLHTVGMLVGCIQSICTLMLISINAIVIGNADNISRNFTFFSSLQMVTRTIILLVNGLVLAIVILCFISSILLLIGTMKNRHRYILPWLVIFVFFIIACFVGDILLFIMLPILIDRPVFYAIPLLLLIAVGLFIYIYWAIYSLFCHIRANRELKSYSIAHNIGDASINIYPNCNGI